MKKKVRIILVLFVSMMVAFIAMFAMLAFVSSSLRHEVTETSADIAAIERRFPFVAGHVIDASWSICYIADPLPVVPAPTDYRIWGRMKIDRKLADSLLSNYEWDETLLSKTDVELLGDADAHQRRWMTSRGLNDSGMGSFVGNMYFDGDTTLFFSGYVL